ncbi:NAD(P)H-hydrate dehydratase [Clostridium sp. JN-9]|uniref:NAD(P)H-hydrate dehydratase n=1 Tax=Clostridium sp. JN-9 TaxID=2507159 RepID=UPI000FFE233F|nr:NAD(P)H-hydrate dehydratase [Clostridium sp. JN-9]QAT41268.1 NAD(P)H-hydrate dehydratase [Clostridium sp. JN-9]
MRVATSLIMRNMDSYCINTLRIPGIILMENAAIKVIENIQLEKLRSFTVVCGIGNNGGDGFAVARHLLLKGKTVQVFLIGSEEKLSNDCKTNFNILKNMNINIKSVKNLEDAYELRDSIEKSQITIDAIFGTGLNRQIQEIYDTVITIINENSSYTISIDVPSGFNSDKGVPMGNCIRADKTISFQMYKQGFLNYGSDRYTGSIVICDIGVPKEVQDKFNENYLIIDRPMIKKLIMVRSKYSYKGDYGRVLLFAGSKGFSGAAFISTEAAVRSGAGLVTLASEKDLLNILSAKLCEAMTADYEDEKKINELIIKSNAVAIGPGMGNNERTLDILKKVLQMSSCGVVIDADGINVLKNNLDLLKNKKNRIVITPHFGEMSRLTGYSIDYIRDNRIQVAKDFAKENQIIVLLKGYNTVITDGSTTIINPTGNSAMASGGVGDCLTGMIASFIAQGYDPLSASCLAAYVHGYSGEKLSQNMYNVTASDILNEIPYSLKELQ